MNEAAAHPEANATLTVDERTSSRRRRWFSPLLAVPTPVIFTVAAALATLVVWRQGRLTEVVDSVHDVHPGRVVAILLVYAASILLLEIRWHALVRMAGGTPRWTASVEVFLTSVIINYAAPIGLAVPTRAALTVRDLEMSPGQSGGGWLGGRARRRGPVRHLRCVARAWWIGSRADDEFRQSDPRAPGGCRGHWCYCDQRRQPIDGDSLSNRSVCRSHAFQPGEHPMLALLAVVLTTGFWGIQLAIMAALLQLFGVAASLSLLLGIMGVPVLVGMLSPLPGGAGVREALMAAAARLGEQPRHQSCWRRLLIDWHSFW